MPKEQKKYIWSQESGQYKMDIDVYPVQVYQWIRSMNYETYL